MRSLTRLSVVGASMLIASGSVWMWNRHRVSETDLIALAASHTASGDIELVNQPFLPLPRLHGAGDVVTIGIDARDNRFIDRVLWDRVAFPELLRMNAVRGRHIWVLVDERLEFQKLGEVLTQLRSAGVVTVEFVVSSHREDEAGKGAQFNACPLRLSAIHNNEDTKVSLDDHGRLYWNGAEIGIMEFRRALAEGARTGAASRIGILLAPKVLVYYAISAICGIGRNDVVASRSAELLN